MADIQTVPTQASVSDFIAAVPDEARRRDSEKVITIMSEETGEVATMWGPAIVGFGSYHYKYPSGREGDMPLVAFSPRKQSLTFYLLASLLKDPEFMEGLGKFTTSKVCLYVKSLSDIDETKLRKLIKASLTRLREEGN
jgi:hypothetical protein